MRPLLSLKYNEVSVIREIHAPEELKLQLMELGIRENMPITIKHRALFDGPILFSTDSLELALDVRIAEKIEVE